MDYLLDRLGGDGTAVEAQPPPSRQCPRWPVNKPLRSWPVKKTLVGRKKRVLNGDVKTPEGRALLSQLMHMGKARLALQRSIDRSVRNAHAILEDPRVHIRSSVEFRSSRKCGDLRVVMGRSFSRRASFTAKQMTDIPLLAASPATVPMKLLRLSVFLFLFLL
eukprot:974803-Pyramimonas_sp.AAC.1